MSIYWDGFRDAEVHGSTIHTSGITDFMYTIGNCIQLVREYSATSDSSCDTHVYRLFKELYLVVWMSVILHQ